MPSETKISFSDGGSTEALRKYSDDYSRKHLADHSVVLTEDTDSFIIGERVWVGGSKPGQIAYIGETQFAPGDWAGIVLDEPIGKNDGSVAGVRYFQCAERRGVFSRLTRLTRAPLASRSPHAASPASDISAAVFTPPSSATPASLAARQRRAMSPNGSIRSAFSSKMNMSVTSTATGELRAGDRVIVSSSQGSKAGILRYVGPTDFASGVWCGVELDDPIGKNDGSVEGKRYFECAPRFGLFAPLSKVSRSPSNRKPGACAIHSNGRSLRRSNSRESLTSLGTSIQSSVRTASRLGAKPAFGSSSQRTSGPRAVSTPVSAKNTLQELLREKQQHLERLMRERELERAEVAKVTLQVDRVQGQLQHALSQSAQASSENEALKAELTRLAKQLEDERQRAEELLFRTEEDNINKEDYNKYKQAVEEEKKAFAKRIEDLEAEVSLSTATAEAAKAAIIAASDKHASELETISLQHKEELQAAQMLSAELQKLLDEAYALLKEKENEKDSLGKSMTEELSRVRAESEKSLNEAKSKLTIAQTEFDYQLSVLNAKLQMAETKLETEKQNTERLIRDSTQTIADLSSKITQTQAALDDKTHELHKVLGTIKEQELSLSKEITKLKMELSSKVADLEELSESNKKYEASAKALEIQLAQIKEDFAKKTNEYESILNETSTQNDAFSLEIKELNQKLTIKNNEYEKLLTESKDTTSATSKLVKEYKELVNEKEKEIIKLKNDFEEATATFNKNQTIIAEEHKKLIEERNMHIDKLTEQVEEHKQIIEKSKLEYDALVLKAGNNVSEIKELIDKNNELNITITKLNNGIDELKNKLSAMEIQNSELERKLNSSNEKCAELQKAKEKVEEEYINLTSDSTNSNDEIIKLTQNLRNAEKELQDTRDTFRDKSNVYERTEQKMNQQMEKLKEDIQNEKDILNETILKSQQDLASSQSKICELEEQMKLMKEKYGEQEINYLSVSNEKCLLEKEIETIKIRELELKSQLQDANMKSEQAIEDLKHKIEILKADGEDSEVKLKEKVDQLVEAQNELNNKLEQAQNNERFLEKNLEEITLQLNNEKTILKKELNDRDSELKLIKEEAEKSSSGITQINSSLQEKDSTIKDLNLRLAMLEVDLKTNADIINEKERQILVNAEQLSKVTEDKHLLEQKLNSSIAEVGSLQVKYENFIAEKSDTDKILKEQQDNIDKLTLDYENLTKDKLRLDLKIQEVSSALVTMTTQYEETLKEAEKSQQKTSELISIAQEKDKIIKDETEKYLNEVAKAKSLEAEKDKIQNLLTDQNSALEEKQNKILQLQDQLQHTSGETNSQIETLNKKIEQLTSTHKAEVETLQKSVKLLESNTKENLTVLENLKKKDTQIFELQELLTKADDDIKKLTNINEGQKKNYEELNIQLQSDYDRLKKEGKHERRSLREKLQEVEKLLEESKAKVNSELLNHSELQKKLDESEKRANELANKVELLTVHQQTSISEQEQLLEKITLELQAARKTSAEALASREELINKLKTDIENKINNLMKQDGHIAKLEEQLKNQKVKTELAERERLFIQQETAAKKMEFIKKDNYNNDDNKESPEDKTVKLKDDSSVVEGQVEFLNSVIVDMQRKNEQLLARVHALETGFSTDSASDRYNFNEAKKTPAPRLFCDICDEFDAHDTEDCPRQAGEHPPSPPRQVAPSPRKPPPPPRPYCDICEVFGHATENCDEEETF